MSPCTAGACGLVGALLAEVGLEVGLERDLLELARCVEFALGSCWLLERSKGPPKAMSVCCVYLGAGGFVTARQTCCPSAVTASHKQSHVMQRMAGFQAGRTDSLAYMQMNGCRSCVAVCCTETKLSCAVSHHYWHVDCKD